MIELFKPFAFKVIIDTVEFKFATNKFYALIYLTLSQVWLNL